MKKEKREIEEKIFKEVSNKDTIIQNCNNILDAKVTCNCKQKIRFKFAIASITCFVLVAIVLMAVFIPQVFRNNKDNVYYYSQDELRWENVNDIASFIKNNNVKVKQLSDNISNAGKVCYHENTYIGILQDLLVMSDHGMEWGTVFIYSTSYVIKNNEEKIYEKIKINDIQVEYIVYINLDERLNEFSFNYKGYKYYFEIRTLSEINFEYYINKIIQ